MSRRKSIFILLVSVLIFATRCTTPTLVRLPTIEPPATPLPTVAPTPLFSGKLGAIDRDMTYCTMNGLALKLDVYYPTKITTRIATALVNIHGGSWSGGDKTQSESADDFAELLKRGYIIFAVNYRLAPAHKFPAQLEDVKCAVRFLRANAATYQIDAQRIGTWGCSAGGQLAALAGVTDASAGFDAHGDYQNESSRVQAVAALAAPADLTLYDVVARADMLKRVFDVSTGINPTLVRASPVTFVTADDPPFLILQADRDSLIVPRHGEKFAERLNSAGGTARLITVKNATHCFPPSPAMSPSREQLSALIADFFDETLRR